MTHNFISIISPEVNVDFVHVGPGVDWLGSPEVGLDVVVLVVVGATVVLGQRVDAGPQQQHGAVTVKWLTVGVSLTVTLPGGCTPTEGITV